MAVNRRSSTQVEDDVWNGRKPHHTLPYQDSETKPNRKGYKTTSQNLKQPFIVMKNVGE